MYYAKLTMPPQNKGWIKKMRQDRKTFGALLSLFEDMANSFATNEATFVMWFKNLPKAVDDGLIRIDHEWQGNTVSFRIMIWSPTEAMYKISDDMNQLEDEMSVAMINYYFNVN